MQQRARYSTRRRSSGAFLLISCVLLAVGAIVIYAGVTSDPERAEKVSAVTAKASEAVSSVVSRVTSMAVRERKVEAVAPAPPPAPPARRRAKAPRRSNEPPQLALQPVNLAQLPAMSPAMLRLKAALEDMTGRAPGPDARVETASAPSTEVWATEYSAADKTVVPPIALGEQLPPSPAEGAASRRIELIVLSDGQVSSAKLLDPPYNVHELMFLSAVKAWKFKPAMKAGQPVTYRKIITIAFR